MARSLPRRFAAYRSLPRRASRGGAGTAPRSIKKAMRKRLKLSIQCGVVAAFVLGFVTAQADAAGADRAVATATPIRHLVVIFGSSISFDHYFGTYPSAANPPGEPPFKLVRGMPNVNGLKGLLLTANLNLINVANRDGAANPFRLDHSQALTVDQAPEYAEEQKAFDFGLMDSFPEFTGAAGPPPGFPPGTVDTTGLVMGYYEGNTVTALWNYAQNYALNDNSYSVNFGSSTVGALNLISGQTNGINNMENGPSSDWISDGNGGLTVIGDPDPIGDICSTSTSDKVQMGGPNIGDLLNKAGVTWGWFAGGFNLRVTNRNGTTG